MCVCVCVWGGGGGGGGGGGYECVCICVIRLQEVTCKWSEPLALFHQHLIACSMQIRMYSRSQIKVPVSLV